VTIRDGTTDIEYGSYGSDDNMLLIEGNILCRELQQGVRNSIAHNIFNKVQYISYRPFNISSIGLPYVECGDAVAYYLYDYSSGTPETHIMGFSVMKRYLKGIQWLDETFSASGNEYQPEVIPIDFGSSNNEQVNQIAKEVSGLEDTVEQHTQEIAGKQDFIDVDILEPSWSASEGHITLFEVTDSGNSMYRWYRMENGNFRKMNFARFGTSDLVPGVTDLPTGEIFLVYE